MNTYIEERLNELRDKYRQTGEAKYRYKYDELKRMVEFLLLDHIRSAQDSEQGERRSTYTPASGGRLPDLNRR